jgi:hypothetical protein
MKSNIHFYPSSTPSTVNKLVDRKRLIWKKLQTQGKTFLSYLIEATVGNSEPKISQHCDRQGHVFWRAYDPISQLSERFESEAEVRIWLEQRYSR